jgi:hypothetical protein
MTYEITVSQAANQQKNVYPSCLMTVQQQNPQLILSIMPYTLTL